MRTFLFSQISNNISNTWHLFYCCLQRKYSVHMPYIHLLEKAEPIIYIEFCLGKLGSTLENKQPETRKLHLYGRETLMSCSMMAALPCRHIAKASSLSRALHGSKWFSIILDCRQNSSFEMYHTKNQNIIFTSVAAKDNIHLQ